MLHNQTRQWRRVLRSGFFAVAADFARGVQGLKNSAQAEPRGRPKQLVGMPAGR
jgi:hypothetical protein